MTVQPLIRVEDLCKDYVSEGVVLHALKHVNLTIAAGEFVAIMGPSGSGKSTLMNVLGCLDVPTRGRYLLQGHDVAALDANRLAELRNTLIGFVFQGFNLLARADAQRNVALPLLYAGVGRRERRERALRALRDVGLESRAHHFPNQLSGGQQQRVAIARALANGPRLILADEPTGNLDTETSSEIMRLFADLNRSHGITVVVVTHEPDVAAFARRLVRFVDGVIAEDRPNHVRAAVEE